MTQRSKQASAPSHLLVKMHESKFFWKNFKKSVDKQGTLWYNSQAVARECISERSLKIEQQEISTKHNKNCVKIYLVNFWENTTQTKVKEQDKSSRLDFSSRPGDKIQWFREFDPGSGWTLAACLTHSSRTVTNPSGFWSVADGWVTREEPAPLWGITTGNSC